MYAHNLRMHLARALAPQRLAAGVVITLALLAAACSNDAASRINAPLLTSHSSDGPSTAASAFSLGGASSFAVLGGTSVTCTASSVTGDVGVSPGTSVTGFPPTSTLCTLAGTVHAGDATAALAHNAFIIAYDALKAMTCPAANNLTGQDLGGMTLAPGVYCFNTTAGLTGQLTLTGSGPWIFQIGTGLTTGSGATGPASVVMAGGGQACNVFWQVGTQATIGTNTAFQGNILAGTAIVFSGTGSSLVGRALAKAEVTMTGTNITLGNCGAAGTPPSCKERGDRVTGGGWIPGKFGGKANFAVSGGIDIKKNAFRGQLEYEDKVSKGKSDDFKVKGTGVTAYIALDDVTRRIDGTAKVNGEVGFTYQVVVSDNGEPGRGKHGDGNDQFAISIFKAGALTYSNSGTLGGGNIQLHERHGRACDKDGHDEELSKGWKVYNIDAATLKWDIDKAAALPGGVAQFPFERFMSMTSGSFAVYLLNNFNFDITGKTISANVAWDQGAYLTRGPAEDGAYVRIVFRDVGSGNFTSNDYWWSSVRLDLNGGTSGTLMAALTDRTLWSNICGQLATDVVAHPGPNCTGGTDPAVSPYDGFSNAMKNVKEVGLSFGRASRFASGVAVTVAPASFRLNSFTITP